MKPLILFALCLAGAFANAERFYFKHPQLFIDELIKATGVQPEPVQGFSVPVARYPVTSVMCGMIPPGGQDEPVTECSLTYGDKSYDFKNAENFYLSLVTAGAKVYEDKDLNSIDLKNMVCLAIDKELVCYGENMYDPK
jgi:hypothetical protein